MNGGSMHVERPSHIQILTVKLTPLLVRLVAYPLDLALRCHALPAELVSAPSTSHMLTPTSLLDPPSALLVRAQLAHRLQYLRGLRFFVPGLGTGSAVVVLVAGLADVPGTFMVEALFEAARGAVHEVPVLDVELAGVAFGVEAPGELCKGGEGVACGNLVVGGECLLARSSLYVGVSQ